MVTTRNRSLRRDEGAVLMFVLLTIVITSLVVMPLLAYTFSVFRAGDVQINKAQAVELARGGSWEALSPHTDVFATCSGVLPSSISGVATTCSVENTVTQLDSSRVPFHVATVQAGATVPPTIATAHTYTNSGSGNIAAWIGDTSTTSTQGAVWLPLLPAAASTVRDSSGYTSLTPILPYGQCTVYFPGTYNDALDLDSPTFFASGVYYFTQPITVRNGADVVVGDSDDSDRSGCTNDTLSRNVDSPPASTNRSGLGATIILGDAAHIDIDDSSGPGDIRFVVNQRYVADDEIDVAASESVSIISVNGDLGGSDLMIDGTLHVPASTVGTAGTPAAIDSGFVASTLTPSATAPNAPTNVTAVAGQRGSGRSRGRLTVSWDVPANNGALITDYVVIHSRRRQTCSPTIYASGTGRLQASCTITGLRDESPASTYGVTVTATNSAGTSPESTPIIAPVDFDTVPAITEPTAPQNVAVGTTYIEGTEVTWNAPASDGGSPVVGYRVTATDTDPTTAPTAIVTCDASWDATGCVLPFANGLTSGRTYDVDVVALQRDLDETPDYSSPAGSIDAVIVPAAGAIPTPTPIGDTADAITADPILDFTTTTDANVSIQIPGYVSVPQGRVVIAATSPTNNTRVDLTGGALAGQLEIDPTHEPTDLDVRFANPVGQRTMRIVSTTTSGITATSTVVVQVNRSRELAINSWTLQ